jgi:DNA repair photolyase
MTSDLQAGQAPQSVQSEFVTPFFLTGIGRLAAESPLEREKKGIQYFSLTVRSVLNRCTNPSMPFAWSINPYRGCEFACKYCYARYTHEFMDFHDPIDFETKVFAKRSVSQILRRELTPNRIGKSTVAIGTATDPYQPAERQFRVTREILQTLSILEGFSFSITTKSDLILRDLELLKEASKRNELRVNLSLTTLDAKLARLLEPKAPQPDRRFRVLKTLVENGIHAGILMMPLLPGLTTSRKSLEDIISRSSAAGARFLHPGMVFLMPSAQALFFPLLKEKFPHLFDKYRKTFGRSAFLPKEYEQKILIQVEELKRKYGIPVDCLSPGVKSSEGKGTVQQLNLGFRQD